MLALLAVVAAAEPRFFSPPQLAFTQQEAAARYSLSTLPARPTYLLARDEARQPVYSPSQTGSIVPPSAFVGALCGLVGAAAWSERKRSASASTGRSGLAAVQMMGRKGRPQIPKQYAQGRQMQQQAPKASVDGMPVFYIYCRSQPGNPWYPVSAFQGDGKAKSLINAWLDAPLLKGVFKEKVEENIARSIFESERRLADLAVQQMPALKKNKTRLNWGYKIIDENLEGKVKEGKIGEEAIAITPVSKGMVKEGLLDGITNKAKEWMGQAGA